MVAIGTPRPSVSTWRLLPSLPRSVGLGPTAAAGVRVLGAVAPSPDSHRPLAGPLDALLLAVPLQARLPQTLQRPALHPPLKAVMHRGCRAKLGWQGSPLAARPQHIQHPVQCPAGVHPRPPAFGVLRRPQDRLGDGPQLVWHSPDCRQRLSRSLAFVQVLPPAKFTGMQEGYRTDS